MDNANTKREMSADMRKATDALDAVRCDCCGSGHASANLYRFDGVYDPATMGGKTLDKLTVKELIAVGAVALKSKESKKVNIHRRDPRKRDEWVKERAEWVSKNPGKELPNRFKNYDCFDLLQAEAQARSSSSQFIGRTNDAMQHWLDVLGRERRVAEKIAQRKMTESDFLSSIFGDQQPTEAERAVLEMNLEAGQASANEPKEASAQAPAPAAAPEPVAVPADQPKKKGWGAWPG